MQMSGFPGSVTMDSNVGFLENGTVFVMGWGVRFFVFSASVREGCFCDKQDLQRAVNNNLLRTELPAFG